VIYSHVPLTISDGRARKVSAAMKPGRSRLAAVRGAGSLPESGLPHEDALNPGYFKG
jgi:hypothetical protein